MYYVLNSYVIKGEKDIKKNHDYTILRQVFDMARDGGDDWVGVEDRFFIHIHIYTNTNTNTNTNYGGTS